MRMYDIIRKKRDGNALTDEEIAFFAKGYTEGSIPDYQVAAMLMAIYYQGMNPEETAALTFAVRDSGEKLDFSSIDGIRVDKHSTGGVGDKTSLVVAPIVASLGVKVAKVSGRGLGHTGGTIDKLESIPGFNTALPEKEFIDIVNRIGVAIVGQTKQLTPLDKKLYALRDVTATVDSLPLIVSSIMGKKLAADDDCIVLDVKTGSGSFMKTIEESRKLARTMVEIGKKAGKKMMALITNMDVPLGNNIGNAIEVMEAIDTLKGHGPKDFTVLCVKLAASMLYLAGKGTIGDCTTMVLNTIEDGHALETFRQMIRAQGGNDRVIDDYAQFGVMEEAYPVSAKQGGYIQHMDTEAIGVASLMLGAGRNTMADTIDPMAGITLIKKPGDKVEKGETVALMYTADKARLPGAEKRFDEAVIYTDRRPQPMQLILDTIE